MGIIKRLLCLHDYYLHRVVYGDEIIGRDYKRYEHRCDKCGSHKFSRSILDGAKC